MLSSCRRISCCLRRVTVRYCRYRPSMVNRADQHRPKQLVDNISTTTHKSHGYMHGIVSEVAPDVRCTYHHPSGSAPLKQLVDNISITTHKSHGYNAWDCIRSGTRREAYISPSERTAPPKQNKCHISE